MPKNKFGGNRAKKGANKHNKKNAAPSETPYASEGTIYAQLTKKEGAVFKAIGTDNVEYCAMLRPRPFVHKDDIVLLAKREYETRQNVCDIIYRYTPEQIKGLIAQGAINFEIKNEDKVDINFGDDKQVDSDYDSDPLAEDEFDDEEFDGDTVPQPLKVIEPLKNHNKKNRANFRDAKSERIQNLTQEVD